MANRTSHLEPGATTVAVRLAMFFRNLSIQALDGIGGIDKASQWVRQDWIDIG
jgi:hypothetical protein